MNRTYSSIKIFIIVFLAITLVSCRAVGINFSHETPVKEDKYPVFTLKDSLKGSLNASRSCYDVTFYNLNVDFDINNKSIKGFVDFYSKSVSAFDTLQIDLFANMKIDSIVFEDKHLEFRRLFDAVLVGMGRTIATDENLKFTVYYHGKPIIAKRPPWEGGMVWKKDKNKNPWLGVACEQIGASLWWPVKDHLSDEPDSMKMSYTFPNGLMCVSNGHLIDSVVHGAKTTYTWQVKYPINTYNATFYAGNFVHFTYPYFGIADTFDFDFYVLPQNLDTARNYFKQAAKIIHYFESVYGPYPWPKDGYKLVESPFAGMEHQTAIAYGNDYKDMFGMGVDHIILHETAHEWWGNSVTATDYAEVWIHEGFATYSEALYIENTRGKEEAKRLLDYYAMLIKNRKPMVGPHGVNFWEYKDTDPYMKGAQMLHTLRNTIFNDSIFFDILKTFYQQHAYKHAESADFIKLVNEKTGKDYTFFFKQYLYNRTCPKLEYEYTFNPKTNKNELYYRFTNVGDDFTIPIKVKTDTKTFLVRPTNKMQRSSMPLDRTIRVNIDDSYIATERIDKYR